MNVVLGMICLLWTVPTFGLMVASFRDQFTIRTSGWWEIFPHKEYRAVEVLEGDQLPRDFDIDVPFSIPIISDEKHSFEEWRSGIEIDDQRIQWLGNRRIGKVEFQEPVITADTRFTFDNYRIVLGGQRFEIQQPDGSIQIVKGDDMWNSFLNSIIVTIPSTVLPILAAAFAAYGFAWMKFPGRRILFVMIIALLVIPLQIALVPILKDYTRIGINGTFLSVWLTHAGFGVGLATYLLYSYIEQIPRELLESAFIDGASHFTIFVKLILPLSVPALASYAIFQFLWVWNDFLIALIFIGETGAEVVTMRLASIVGSRGNDWHLLTSGAFVTMVLPLIVFFSLQRYFVRGLMAGSVKG